MPWLDFMGIPLGLQWDKYDPLARCPDWGREIASPFLLPKRGLRVVSAERSSEAIGETEKTKKLNFQSGLK